VVKNNEALGGSGSSGGSDGAGVGGGVYVSPGAAGTADAQTFVYLNFASTTNADIFGTL
jgi:hypothetical protein